MAISLKNIRPGECFVTGGGQVRRILEVEAKAKLVDKQRNKIETEVLKIGYEVPRQKITPERLDMGIDYACVGKKVRGRRTEKGYLGLRSRLS